VRQIALAIPIIAVLAVAPQTASLDRPDTQWPPPGVEVFTPRTGVMPPRLLREVKPNYTGDALRARIRGKVTLQCVVQIDGSVGAIHLLQSLDPKYGLDDEAIAALKQWRFAPATKDGVPVPVIVDVELVFTLGLTAPELTWPEGFEPDPSAAIATAAWHDDTTDIGGLRIRVEYPSGWTLRKNGRDEEIVELRKSGSLSRISVARPFAVAYSLDRSVLATQLRDISERITKANAARGLVLDAVALGQAPPSPPTWAWFEYQTSTVSTPDALPAVAAAAQELFESARIWVFETTAGGRAVSVTCTAIVPRGATDAQKAQARAAQAAEFGAIVRRMKVDVR
jgi:TonB family protein